MEETWTWIWQNREYWWPAAVFGAIAIAKRLRWTPELLWCMTRGLYRYGSRTEGFAGWFASVLVPPIALLETPAALTLQPLFGIRPKSGGVDVFDMFASVAVRTSRLEEEVRHERGERHKLSQAVADGVGRVEAFEVLRQGDVARIERLENPLVSVEDGGVDWLELPPEQSPQITEAWVRESVDHAWHAPDCELAPPNDAKRTVLRTLKTELPDGKVCWRCAKARGSA